MKKFKVKARKGNGSFEEIIFEAPDRSKLFQLLKMKGITPVAVTECSAQKKTSNTVNREASSRNVWRLPIALVAILATVVAVVILIMKFSCNGEISAPEREDKSLKANKIKEEIPARPKKVVTNENQKSDKKQIPHSQRWRQDVFTNKYGYVMNLKGGSYTNSPENLPRRKLPMRIFKNYVDRRIGSLLDMKPGETLIGDSALMFGKSFVREFEKSLETPIVIEPDDTPEAAELKRAVRETKAELKQRLDAGEDITKLLIDTRNDMQQLGLYRNELIQEINKIARDRTLTEADMEDFVKAANSMLEGRGAQPLSMPSFAVRRFQMLRDREERKKSQGSN